MRAANLTEKQAAALLAHLREADIDLRNLYGFYWHRRKDGIPESRRRELAATIKRGERQIALICRKARLS